MLALEASVAPRVENVRPGCDSTASSGRSTAWRQRSHNQPRSGKASPVRYPIASSAARDRKPIHDRCAPVHVRPKSVRSRRFPILHGIAALSDSLPGRLRANAANPHVSYSLSRCFQGYEQVVRLDRQSTGRRSYLPIRTAPPGDENS